MKNKTDKFQDASLLAIRLIVATIFFSAAYGKYGYLAAGAPGATPYMIYLLKFLMIVEPLGAIALISGFLTRWAAKGLGVIMIGAIIMLKYTMNTPFFTSPGVIGWDYNLILLGCCIALVAFGAGGYSIDKIKNID